MAIGGVEYEVYDDTRRRSGGGAEMCSAGGFQASAFQILQLVCRYNKGGDDAKRQMDLERMENEAMVGLYKL